MISKGIRGSCFRGLMKYLTRQDGAVIAATWNLGSLDPVHVVGFMKLTAGASRCKKPVYHVPIRPDPGDRQLTDQEWIDVGSRLLRGLHLGGHQAFIVLHGSGPTRHAHLVVNRVCDGRAAPLRHDYAEREKILRGLECSLGLRRVAGRFYDEEGRDRRKTEAAARLQGALPPERPVKRFTDGERRRTGREGSRSRIHVVVPQIYRSGHAGHSFQQALADRGLVLARGRKSGFVVVDVGNDTSASLSRVLRREERQRVLDGLGATALPTREDASRWLERHKLGAAVAVVAPGASRNHRRGLTPAMPSRSIAAIQAGFEQSGDHVRRPVQLPSIIPVRNAQSERTTALERDRSCFRSLMPAPVSRHAALVQAQLADLMAQFAATRDAGLRARLAAAIKKKEEELHRENAMARLNHKLHRSRLKQQGRSER